MSSHYPSSQILKKPYVKLADLPSLFPRAEGSSLASCSLSLHFFMEELDGKPILPNIEHNKKLLRTKYAKQNPLIQELYNKKYPLSSLNSALKCGDYVDDMVKTCGCGPSLVKVYHKCNLRVCPRCSVRRSKYLKRRYLPFLKNAKLDKTFKLYFLTYSPVNYDNLIEGRKHIQKTISKWRRHKEIKDKVQGGISVIEESKVNVGDPINDRTTGEFLYYAKKESWNIHVHMILYSRRLDHQTKGKCLKCNRKNILNYDKINQEYYCSHKKCNSRIILEGSIEESKVNQAFFKASSGRIGRTRIDEVKHSNVDKEKVINYLLKYISIDKNAINSPEDLAEYMIASRRKRLITKFGCFYNKKLPPEEQPCCKKCGGEISYTHDAQAVNELIKANLLNNYMEEGIPPDNIDILD